MPSLLPIVKAIGPASPTTSSQPRELARPAPPRHLHRMSGDAVEASTLFQRLAENIGKVLRGQEPATRRLLSAFAAGGHVLLDDFPGTGKTTLAKTLALSLDSQFHRIQFTPDLLPTDILGVSVFHPLTQDFHFREGPVFTDILLADEINRASPRTQSALLEAMAESQVSLEGQPRPLSDLFFVIATQNPVEFRGTYPLPEAQMDRFMMRFGLGYVSAQDEVAILSGQRNEHPLVHIRPCCQPDEIRRLRQAVRQVRISEEILHYIVSLVQATRQLPGVPLGASPRASLALMKASQALALFDGRPFVLPDHVAELAVSVIAHRLVLDPEARFAGTTAEGLIENLVRHHPRPR